eukprot:GGOE01014135.1.p1 GENE.GGOE01014135.1~~GGOE01014135.1.p1  ORF type:complete len:386 (+),score=96.24 GGOE01014135.1:3-1160(+)
MRPASAAVRRPPSPTPSRSRPTLKCAAASPHHSSPLHLEQLQRNKERTIRAEERLQQNFALRIQRLTNPCNLHRKVRGDSVCGRCLLAELNTVEERCFGRSDTRDSGPPPAPEEIQSVRERPTKAKAAKGPAKSVRQRLKEREEEEARQRQLEDEQAERRLADAAVRNKQRNERYILMGLQRLQQPLLHRFVEVVEFPAIIKALGFKGDPASYAGKHATISCPLLASVLSSLVPAGSFSARDIQTLIEMFTVEEARLLVSELSITFLACAGRRDSRSWLKYFYLCQVLTPSLLDGNEPTVTPLELHALAHVMAEAAGAMDNMVIRLRRHVQLSTAWQGKTSLAFPVWFFALQEEDPELADALQPEWTFPFAPPKPQAVVSPAPPT